MEKQKKVKVKKEKKPNLLTRWYKLVNPHKGYWFLQTFFYVCYAAIYAVMTIIAAKTINCLYNADWHGAFVWLSIEFANVFLRNICLHMQYVFYGKHYKIMRHNISAKIFDKLFKTDDNALKTFTTEKIINIAQENLANACEFPDMLAQIASNIIRIVIAVVAIFTSNIYAGLVVLAIAVINFLVYNTLNKKLGRIMNVRFEKKDHSFQSYSKILSGKIVIDELNAKENYKKQLLNDVDEFGREYEKYYNTQSARDNLYYIGWNIMVYATTFLLVYMVSQNTFDIALYLVVVPYLTSCTERLNNLYTKLGGAENVRVDVDRLEMILSLDEKQLIQYGDVNTVSDGYNLGFLNVTYADPKTNKNLLTNADISFKTKGVNIVRGAKGSGKRAIFNLLRRTIKPTSGTIVLDNLDLYNYNQKTFKQHINFCVAHPPFVSGSVKENLMLAEPDFKKVEALINEMGLNGVINNLTLGYNTQLSEIKDEETRFYLGFIRAALYKSKILMIYDVPSGVSAEFSERFKKLIAASEANKRTIILFTHNNFYDDIAHQVFEVKAGTVKLVEKK